MAGGAMSVPDAATMGTPTQEPSVMVMVIGAVVGMIVTTGAEVVAMDDADATPSRIPTML